MLSYERSRVTAAAQAILDADDWCVVEICVDVPGQRWEPRVLVCERDPEVVADIVERELGRERRSDVRLSGCDRRTLQLHPRRAISAPG